MTADSLLFRALELYGTRLSHRGQGWLHAQLRKRCGVELNVELEVFRQGLRWQLNPADLVQRNLFWLGTEDHWDLFHLKRVLKSGSVLFDVGANFGYYSLTLAHYLSRQCHVQAFEPNPPTHARLLKHIALNQLGTVITPHRLALSDVPGTGYLRDETGNHADFNSGAASLGAHRDGVPVPVVTLDDFCGSQNINRLDFLKIDVEGFEAHVLRGAAVSLAKFQPLLCIELNPSTLTRQNTSVKNVADMLGQFGYQLFVARRDKLEPLRHLPAGGEYMNALGFPRTQPPA
jgi:FkbM family methyltransferase